MPDRIRSILIVGGGTAGWLSAAYLQRALPGDVQITLVESDRIPRIGVGEATIPTLVQTLAFLGLRESDWMPAVGASYKTAIKFACWNRPRESGEQEYYWHPFASRPEPSVLPYEQPWFPEIGRGISLLQYALKRRLEGSRRSIAEMMLATPAICEAMKAPRHPEDPSLGVISAYHLDASVFAGFLRDRVVARGVRHVLGDVEHVRRAEDGGIASVLLSDGRELSAHLFIDCTGFAGLLLNKALGVRFISDNDKLLTDSAVAISKRTNPARDGLPPYTTATALKHGWCWDIPLQHRAGCGYVYSSAFVGKDTAEAELRDFLGEGVEGEEARHIRIRVGHSERLWVKNCVAIGLSGSFIEPLESTGIFLIEHGLAALVTLFPDCSFDPATAERYNTLMREVYEETRDFVQLHYLAARRDDTPFWWAARGDVVIPDSLREKLAFFEGRLPVLDEVKLTVFRAFNYTCILDGCGRLPRRPHPLLEQLGYDKGFAMLDAIAADTSRRVAALPDNYQYLSSMGR